MAVWRHRGARQWENEGREDAFCLSGSQRWGILLSASDQYFPIGNSCNFVTGRCFTRTGSLRVTRAFPTPSLLLSLIQTLGYGWDLWLSYLVLQLFSYWKHLTISLPTVYKVLLLHAVRLQWDNSQGPRVTLQMVYRIAAAVWLRLLKPSRNLDAPALGQCCWGLLQVCETLRL